MMKGKHIIAMTGSILLLAGCGSGAQNSQLSPISPSGSAAMFRAESQPRPMSTFVPYCLTSGGVSVSTCPVTLKSATGKHIAIKGPRVNVTYVQSGCGSDDICGLDRTGPNVNKDWMIYPGALCGTDEVVFDAYNAKGGLVGAVYLGVYQDYGSGSNCTKH